MIMAITFAIDEQAEVATAACLLGFGEIEMMSADFEFNHTDYYEREMGPGLRKRFLSINGLHHRDQLVVLKMKAMQTEQNTSMENQRRVNLDPAYMELSKLVVASTKNFSHRIHISQGIFGDVQLCFQNQDFVPYSWTYPDYVSDVALAFFRNVRKQYHKQLYS